MQCKGILKKYDNQELSPSSIEHTVFDDRISNLILDFVDTARGDVEIVVSKGKISIRQIDLNTVTMENKTKKTFHVCANIDEEIKRIATTGKTIFGESPTNMLAILEDAKNDGKTRYAGCNNMIEDGRCGGHEQST